MLSSGANSAPEAAYTSASSSQLPKPSQHKPGQSTRSISEVAPAEPCDDRPTKQRVRVAEEAHQETPSPSELFTDKPVNKSFESLQQSHKEVHPERSGNLNVKALLAGLERYRLCPALGGLLHETRLLPCKVPIEGLLEASAESLGMMQSLSLANSDSTHRHLRPRELLKLCEDRGTKIGLVVDVDGSKSYYKGYDVTEHGVEYLRVAVPEETVPDPFILDSVLAFIDRFCKRSNNCVAIHCSDGINRTGYFCVAYLLLRTEEGACLTAREAVRAFEVARGCRMDSRLLLDALETLAAGRKEP